MAYRGLGIVAASGLVIYSATLLWIELTTSQDYVRNFFTDIGQAAKPGYFAASTGDILFYAVNTSLSAFLLGCAGVLLFFTSHADAKAPAGQTLFFDCQGALLLWMALDERFMLHETIGSAVNVPSSVVLAAPVMANLILYFCNFRLAYFSLRMARLLAAAGALFVAMMVFDVLLPHDMPLRLSLEDLAKTWAGFALLSFAWESARFHLFGKMHGEEAMRLPVRLAAHVPPGWRARLTP